MGGLSLEIARTHLKACDPTYTTRSWGDVMDAIMSTKEGETLVRWQVAIQDRPFDLIRHLPLVQTRPEHFQEVLQKGTVSTNVYLRRLHNFALDMQWILAAVLPKRQAVFDQGHTVGALAKALYPDGIEIGEGVLDPEETVRLTDKARPSPQC